MKIAVALLIAFLSGCGWTQGPLRIAFVGSREKEGVLRDLVYRFEQGSGIQAEVLFQQDEPPRSGGRQEAAPAADVVLADAGRLRYLASFGALREIAVPAAETFPAARAALTVGGKLYGQPWVGRLWVFAYQEKMLEKAGILSPPASEAQLRSAAFKLAQKRIALQPLIWPWNGDGIVESFAAFLAGQDRREPYRLPLDDVAEEQAAAALQWMMDSLQVSKLTDPSSFFLGEEEVARNFYMGHKAFMANWHDFCERGKRDQSYPAGGHCRVMAVPGVVAEQATALLHVRGAGILAASRRPDDAAKFVAFLMSRKAQEAYCPLLECLPMSRRFYEEGTADPLFSQLDDYRRILEEARPWIAPDCAEEAAAVLRAWLRSGRHGQSSSQVSPAEAAAELLSLLRSCPAGGEGEPQAASGGARGKPLGLHVRAAQ